MIERGKTSLRAPFRACEGSASEKGRHPVRRCSQASATVPMHGRAPSRAHAQITPNAGHRCRSGPHGGPELPNPQPCQEVPPTRQARPCPNPQPFPSMPIEPPADHYRLPARGAKRRPRNRPSNLRPAGQGAARRAATAGPPPYKADSLIRPCRRRPQKGPQANPPLRRSPT